ncbi:hypothetical protein SpCBS45565_g08283 [Spizellomyces sp. 'palustris']|nr:hypothetical protein SpCBS45565_g08283 [Spizellomyces sp. 'palustris']
MRVRLILSTALALVASLATVDAQVNLPPAGYPGPDSSSVTVASSGATPTSPPAPSATSEVVIKSAESTLAPGGIETISINQGTQPPPPPPQQTSPPPPPPQQPSPSPTAPPVTVATQETRTNGGNQVTVTFLPHDPSTTRGNESGGNGGNIQTVTVTKTVTIQVTNAAACNTNTKSKGKHGHGKKSGNKGNGNNGNGNNNNGNGNGGMALVDAIREIFQLEPLPNANQRRGNSNFASSKPAQTRREPHLPAGKNLSQLNSNNVGSERLLVFHSQQFCDRGRLLHKREVLGHDALSPGT